ncbi:MAG: NADP-dependent oxidoreductase [Solirubrobacteraceae bacterium]
MRAVRFDRYGGSEVLDVRDVETPSAGPGELLIAMRAAAINPGEAKIREGLLHDRFPATFPSGQGSDLAGVVSAVGDGVRGFAAGDEVIGFTDRRASHAELVVVSAANATARPAAVPWEVAGSLYVAGCTAWAATRAVAAGPGDTVVVAGAAGGVGCIAVQLARRTGAAVIGLASQPNHYWLREHGVTPVQYGDGVRERIEAVAPAGVDALIDTAGGGYVELALELGVAPQRIDTIVDFRAVGKYSVKAEGNAAGASADVLAELAGLVAAGELEVPIAAVYPLERVRDAYDELARGHTRGKIVLIA